MTEASFIQYLDEEYQRIQEYLSSLVDTIPVINLDAVQDADSLIISLVDQNKAYGNQIISLYKTLDSVTGAKSLHETSENPGSLTNLDSVNRLQDKLKQYEDLIQELSSENEGLFSQIRELSLQVKTIQAKQEHQQNLSMISQIHHPDITAVNQPPKTTVSSARTTLVHSPNELSFDLENLFILGEVRKASEILTQMEYRKPHHVTIEKYNSWLIKSNKVKDLEIHEALTKLKSIVEAIEYEGDQVKDQKRQSYEFEDSLDHANVSPLEKVMNQLEEKLGKVLIHNEQLRSANASQLESSRYTRGGYDRFRNSEIKEAAEHLETENGMNTEVLHDKVKFLRENLEDMERELREKHAEVEMLKERLEKVKSGHSRPGSVTGNENLMKELENEMKARNQVEDKLQEVVSENEELRNAYDVAKKQNETCNRRIKDLYEQLNEKDQIIDKFVRDNEQIRKNKSSLHDSNMLEQLKTDLSFKNSEISQLSRDITQLKDNRKANAEPKSTTRRAIPQTTDDAEGSTQRLRDVSALEAALHTQEDLLFHLKQASKESKEYLIEALKKSQLDLPQVSENKLRDEPSSPTTEAQRIIKENNQIIHELIKEAHFLKVGNQMLATPSTKRQNASRTVDFSDMINKLHQEEEKLIEKLSRSLKVLSQLRTSVCDILVASEDPHYLNNPSLVFLQDLYTNINQALQSLQSLSSEFAVIEKKDSENDQQVSEQKRVPKSIKDQLIRDQNELKDRLQVFAQNLNTEENHDRLSQDQEINQSLYKQLLEKDVIINEIIILFTEGLERTNESISQLAKIADSEDAFVLVGDVLNEVDVMKTKLKELVAFEQGEKPQITSNTENDEIYRRSEPRLEENVEGDDNQNEGDVNDEVEEEIPEEEENANEHILMKLQELERENWDLKEYKNSADATLKKLQDQNSKLKMMYFTEINAVKEEQKALLEERRQLRSDVEKKCQEVTKLSQILESLQTFSNKQLEVVKDKEQKLQALTGQKKDSDQWMKDLEKKIEDFVKEKKQYEEVIAKKEEEIDLLKRESIETMQRYIELQEQHKELNHKFSEVVERIKILEEERELLVGGKTEIESKVKKLNELLQVTRNELRNYRQLVEEKNYDIGQMEDEIRSLKEAIKKERSLNKESDFVMHLKSELKSQNTELDALKKKYSEILKLNEFLQSDVHTPTGVTRRNDQFIKELDKSSTYIRETPETVDALQKSLKRRDAASSIEKSGYLNDSRQMHRNMSVSESNWNIEGYAKDHKNSMVLNSEPRHSKVSNIAISRDGGGHSRKISMLDEKDLEIQRLTNVLRDLTKSLGISQEAKKNIINTRMQKSSVLE